MVKNFQFPKWLFPVIPQAWIHLQFIKSPPAMELATEETTYLLGVEIHSTLEPLPPRSNLKKKRMLILFALVAQEGRNKGTWDLISFLWLMDRLR